MQITLVQTEIEHAIRNHILSQINIREGMDIHIELSATRGADGYTAIIDVLAPGMARPTRRVGRQPQSGKARVTQTQENVKANAAGPSAIPEPRSLFRSSNRPLNA